MNSLDYNEGLDVVVISFFFSNEIALIDHGTSSVDAAGSTGGRYGFGGDLLYRFGNP